MLQSQDSYKNLEERFNRIDPCSFRRKKCFNRHKKVILYYSYSCSHRIVTKIWKKGLIELIHVHLEERNVLIDARKLSYIFS